MYDGSYKLTSMSHSSVPNRRHWKWRLMFVINTSHVVISSLNNCECILLIMACVFWNFQREKIMVANLEKESKKAKKVEY